MQVRKSPPLPCRSGAEEPLADSEKGGDSQAESTKRRAADLQGPTRNYCAPAGRRAPSSPDFHLRFGSCNNSELLSNHHRPRTALAVSDRSRLAVSDRSRLAVSDRYRPRTLSASRTAIGLGPRDDRYAYRPRTRSPPRTAVGLGPLPPCERSPFDLSFSLTKGGVP